MSDPFRCARTWISHISLCRRMCVLEATRAQFTTCAGKYLTVRKMSVASCLDLERLAEGFEALEGGQTAGSNPLKNRWLGRGCEELLPVALERPAEGFEAFATTGRTPLAPLKTDCWGVAARVVASCLGKACGRVWSVCDHGSNSLGALKNRLLGRGCESCCQLPGKGLREGLKRLRAGKQMAGAWLRELLPVAWERLAGGFETFGD